MKQFLTFIEFYVSIVAEMPKNQMFVIIVKNKKPEKSGFLLEIIKYIGSILFIRYKFQPNTLCFKGIPHQ